MTENECQGPGKCGWVESERLLARTFDQWRAEFREILEDHRRDIQGRLETIERRIELKSDKESVDLIVRGIHEELTRHADDIKSLRTEVGTRVGTDTLWKIAGLVVKLGGVLSGIISILINHLQR
jgi:predicted phage gp36 major capsid-like protein